LKNNNRALPALTVKKLKETLKDMPEEALIYFEDLAEFRKENIAVLRPDPGIESNNFINFSITFIPASDTIRYDNDDNLYIIASFMVEK
jgi:hypothetical protein